MHFLSGVVAAVSASLAAADTAVNIAPPEGRPPAVVDLKRLFNQEDSLKIFDMIIPGDMSRLSGAQLAWMPWDSVPALVKTRTRKPHKDMDPAIRVMVRVQPNPPGLCPGVTGQIIYYLWLDNSGASMWSFADGWDTLAENNNACMIDNGSACLADMTDKLRWVVPYNITLVERIFRGPFGSSSDERFGSYQVLPEWSGSVNERDGVHIVLERDTIVSRSNSLCMDVGDESAVLVKQWACNHTRWQKFAQIPTTDGYFMIQNVGSLKCLAILGGGSENGALLAQYNCDSADNNHHWRVTDPGGNPFRAKWLINRRTGKCVEVPGWSTSNGTALSQLDCEMTEKQYWYNVVNATDL